MFTDEQVEGSKIFESIQAALETPNSLVPAIRKAGREHHGSMAGTPRREYYVDCTLRSILEGQAPDRSEFCEIAAYVARECIGGVLLVTIETLTSGGGPTYFYGHEKDLDVVELTQRALIMTLDDYSESPKCTSSLDIGSYHTDGLYKGMLRQVAFPSKPEPKYDSVVDSLVREKEARACWALMMMGVTPSAINLTPFLSDYLDEIARVEGYSNGCKL